MSLEDRIILPPIKIMEEDKGGYKVLYNNQEVYIAKGNSSSFSLNGFRHNQGIELQILLTPEAEITQDYDVPQEFLLAMMFHELREKEYVEAGLDNPHERALNDEVLFVLKNLNPAGRDNYFKFADNYRTRVLEELRKREEAEEQNKIKERLQERIKDEGGISGDFNIYQGIRLVEDKSIVRKRIFICTNEETAERINGLTEEYFGVGRKGTIRYGGVLNLNHIYKHIGGLKESCSDFNPALITGSKELNDYLINQGIHETRLYSPLEDPKPFNRLKKIVNE